MAAAAGGVGTVAWAPPVGSSAGGSGSTVIPLPPVLATISDALKVCPRLSVPGRLNDCAASTGGPTTVRVFELTAATAIGPAELASVPATPVETWSAPGPLPDSA